MDVSRIKTLVASWNITLSVHTKDMTTSLEWIVGGWCMNILQRMFFACKHNIYRHERRYAFLESWRVVQSDVYQIGRNTRIRTFSKLRVKKQQYTLKKKNDFWIRAVIDTECVKKLSVLTASRCSEFFSQTSRRNQKCSVVVGGGVSLDRSVCLLIHQLWVNKSNDTHVLRQKLWNRKISCSAQKCLCIHKSSKLNSIRKKLDYLFCIHVLISHVYLFICV